MVSDTPIGAGPAYLVVMPLRVVAEDIATTIVELDPGATVVVARSIAEAAERLAGLDRLVLAVIEGAPAVFHDTPFGQALANRGVRVLLLGDGVDTAKPGSRIALLGLPFTTGALVAALRRALA